MENTVIHYIINNIWLFLPLGIAGIIFTLFLFFTGKRETLPKDDNLITDHKKLFGFSINIFGLIYLVIWIFLIVIGILSDFLIPTIIGGVIAVIPLILLIFSNDNAGSSKLR